MKDFAQIIEDIKSIIASEVQKQRVYDKDVAEALGISRMNLASLKKRNSIPFRELLDFCARRSISINWLLYDQAPESLVESTNRYYRIKYFDDILASAGGGAHNEDEQAAMLDLPEPFVNMLDRYGNIDAIEALRVSGDSMEPTISDGDLIFIDRSKCDIYRGGVFVLYAEGGLFIKRILQRVDGKVDIVSDNDIYPIQTVNPQEIRIVGRVVAKFARL